MLLLLPLLIQALIQLLQLALPLYRPSNRMFQMQVMLPASPYGYIPLVKVGHRAVPTAFNFAFPFCESVIFIDGPHPVGPSA